MRYLVSLFILLVLLSGCGRNSESVTGSPDESHVAIALTCVEFATADDQAVFNSTGLIRAGAKISAKPAQECKGRMLDQVTIK